MGEFSFPRSLHIKRPTEFKAVYGRGLKRHSRGFVFFRFPNGLEHSRLGVSVSRKVGGAVVRNRVKRRMREAFRLNWRHWGLRGTDLVIVAKRAAASLETTEILQEFAGVLPAGRRP